MTAATALGLFGSLALFPLVALQGTLTRRRVPCLPPVQPPHHGFVPGRGSTIRLLAIGESTVAGVGLAHSEETVAATTARALARRTQRPSRGTALASPERPSTKRRSGCCRE